MDHADWLTEQFEARRPRLRAVATACSAPTSTIVDGRIVEIDVTGDPERIGRLDVVLVDD